MTQSQLELTILMPCLNEVKSVGICVEKAMGFIARNNINGEVLIADNGSTDGSQALAASLGARVVQIPEKGYGAALAGGIKHAYGDYIIMGDSDDSYDFIHLEGFVEKLRQGYDLVMGNRFKGGIDQGAMPGLHQYLGNPTISFIGRTFFGAKIGDFYCGLRGFRRDKVEEMDIRSTGMSFALEMVVKSTILKFKVTEVPTTLKPDKRGRAPHLKTWVDGWKSLRFFFVYSPRWVFAYPGLLMFLVGILMAIRLSFGPLTFGGINLDVHTLVFSGAMSVIGLQAISFYLLARAFAIRDGYLPNKKQLESIYKYVNFDNCFFTGIFVFLIGIFISWDSFSSWKQAGFGNLDNFSTLRQVIPGATVIILGWQIIFHALFSAILTVKEA